MRIKVKTLVATAIVAIAVVGGLWFPVKQLIEGDLQETVVISNRKYAAGSEAAFRVVIRHRKFKLPIKDATVKIYLDSATKKDFPLGEYKTNDRGTIEGKVRIPDNVKGEHSIILKTNSFFGKDAVSAAVKIYNPAQVILSTNKPVYRPGETIRIRSILRNPHTGIPGADKEILYEIYDSKGNKVCYQKATSSKFGISSTDFLLASVVNHGIYTINVSEGENSAIKRVEVKDYSLPNFKTAFFPGKQYFLPGEDIYGRLETIYFFGKPVAYAKVEITTEAFLEGGKDPVDNFRKRTVLEKKSDEKGVLNFDFRTYGESKYKSGLLLLNIRVYDEAGNVISANKAVNISAETIQLQAIPEMGALVPGVENRIYVITKRPDGVPLACKLEMDGKVFASDKQGLAVLNCKLGKEVSEISIKANRAGWRSSSKTIKEDLEVLPVIIRTDKGYYPSLTDQERSAQVNLTASPGIEQVFLDVIQGNQRVLTTDVELKNGKGELSIPIDSLYGMVTLEAYIIDPKGTRRSSSSRIFVQPVRSGIKIDVDADRQVYAPGDKAKLRIQLKDKQGAPVPGALSINIADEKVLSFAGADFSFLNPALISSEPVVLTNLFNCGLKDNADLQELAKALILQTDTPAFERQKLTDMLVKEGFIREDMVKDTIEYYKDKKDLSYLNPDLQEIVERISGNVSQDSTQTTGADKVWKENRRWGIFGHFVLTISILTGIILLIVFLAMASKTRIISWLIALAVICILAAMLLPALSMARESARKISYSNNLKQIGLSMRMAESAGFDIDKYAVARKKTEKEVRIRKYFPETLYWQPELVTDDTGRAEIDLQLADSITTWQGVFDAIDLKGRLGSVEVPIRVFKDFFVDINMPQQMTLHDQTSIPVTCYNYLKKPQTINLRIIGSYGLGLLSEKDMQLQLEPAEVKTVLIKVQGIKVGTYALKIIAKGSKSSDALEEKVKIIPSGKQLKTVKQGILSSQGAEYMLNLPENAIPNSEEFYLKIYPNVISEAVDGLDAMLRQPHGCFEQTSSTTYPNVMILQYLKKAGKLSPNVESKARKYIDTGYQRLLTFEVKGGGFSLYGKSPASRHLTAYGILEFTDIAKVRFVDEKVIKRAAEWLYSQQEKNGSWGNNLQETAYIAWSLSEACRNSEALTKALNYLRKSGNNSYLSVYNKALIANTLLTCDPQDSFGLALADQVAKDAVVKKDDAYWSFNKRTITRSYGNSSNIETTALAVIALRKAGTALSLRRKAVHWLTTNKSEYGAWGTTQATILSIMALLNEKLTGKQGRDVVVDLAVNGKQIPAIEIKKEASDLVRYIGLNRYIKQGSNQFSLRVSGGAEFSYVLEGSYWLPETAVVKPNNKLNIELKYNRLSLKKGDNIRCYLTVVNGTKRTIPNPIIIVGQAAGFTLHLPAFQRLLQMKLIERYEIDRDKIILYLNELEPEEKFSFDYSMTAGLPLQISMPSAKIYEYYDPDNSAESGRQTVTVE